MKRERIYQTLIDADLGPVHSVTQCEVILILYIWFNMLLVKTLQRAWNNILYSVSHILM